MEDKGGLNEPVSASFICLIATPQLRIAEYLPASLEDSAGVLDLYTSRCSFTVKIRLEITSAQTFLWDAPSSQSNQLDRLSCGT